VQINEECGNIETFIDVQSALKTLEKCCNKSEKAYIFKKIETTSQEIMNQIANNIKNCDKIVKETFKQSVLRIKNHCKKLKMENIERALEIYFWHVIYTDLFPYICAKNQNLDSQVNQKILTISQCPLKKLTEFEATLPGSKANLTLLIYLTNPYSKLDALNKLLSLPSLQSKNPVSSDQLLPWLINALSNCQICNFYSQLDFMSNFNISQEIPQQDYFNLATFEAALEHLRNFCDNYKTSELWCTNDLELDLLFQAIYNDDLKQVETCLETP